MKKHETWKFKLWYLYWIRILFLLEKRIVIYYLLIMPYNSVLLKKTSYMFITRSTVHRWPVFRVAHESYQFHAAKSLCSVFLLYCNNLCFNSFPTPGDIVLNLFIQHGHFDTGPLRYAFNSACSNKFSLSPLPIFTVEATLSVIENNLVIKSFQCFSNFSISCL